MKDILKREKKTLEFMLKLYCKQKHKIKEGLCENCHGLLEYAYERIDNCNFAKNKPVCAKCSIQCYETEMRKKIRNVMKFSGPRMMLYHPVITIEHVIHSLRRKKF